MNNMNAEWVAKSIGYHGQPLQKVWEGEHGDYNLFSLGITNPDYSVYQARQKQFAFQDRTKRLKFHSFIAKKAKELFTNNASVELAKSNRAINKIDINKETDTKDLFAVMPALNTFLPETVKKYEQVKHLYSQLNVGDIVYGQIQNRVAAGCTIRVLCTFSTSYLVFHDLNAKAFLPHSVQVPAIDTKGSIRNYENNDYVCCEIIEINNSSDRMVVGMKAQFYQRQSTNVVTFGLIMLDQMPDIYKFSIACLNKTYESVLESLPGFRNPNCIEHLSQAIGLDSSIFYTNMSGLRGKYPNEEYATELRQSQASSWAFRSVAEGIEHFKEGRHSEAFQCLNKALTIDPRNVEGLVARGALYANNGSFKKAVDDFETALKINPSHANARKYMGETLVALGRSYEEDNRIDDAKKAYQDCLAIIPHHEEAQNSLNFLWNKGNTSAKQMIELNDLALPALNIKISEQNRSEGPLGGSSSVTESRKESSSKKSKKKKSKSRKRHSSSSSSSDSSESSESSSGESSSSSDSSSSSESDRSKSKKKKKRSDKTRQRSLSPLSKRMALLSGAGADPAAVDANAYNYAQTFGSGSAVEAIPNEYDLRVNKFLDMTRDEDNYEEKVRKFVEEASKYTKDRKIQEEKSKKKERKKSKKNKKDSKKKKKEKKSKSSKKDKDDVIDGMELREALKIFTKLPLFEMNTKKITSDIETVEKTLNQLKEEEKKMAALDRKPEEESKWKMMFAKDEKKEVKIPKQYAFTNEEDADSEPANNSDRNYRKSADRKNTSSYQPSSSSRSRYDDVKAAAPIQSHQPPTAGPSVLDKFGSFRRAPNVDQTNNFIPDKPPEPPAYRRSSRSRSRSRSRSNRSRSRSYGRRRSGSFSRRKSRSYSSRSRSGSGDRRDRRRWPTYYRPRFGNNNRSNRFNRGGNYKNFRDFRNNRGRDRWNNNRGGWVNRGGNGGGGGKFRNFRDDSRERRFYRRSRSRNDRSRSRSDRSRSRSGSERNVTPPPLPPSPKNEQPPTNVTGEQSVEDIERMLDKAKRENKEEMIERNRDLVKNAN